MTAHFKFIFYYLCSLLTVQSFAVSTVVGVNVNELNNLKPNLPLEINQRRKLQQDFPPILTEEGNCENDQTGLLDGIDFNDPEFSLSCTHLHFWISEIGQISGYSKFDCSIQLKEINIRGVPLDKFGDMSLQDLCPASCVQSCDDGDLTFGLRSSSFFSSESNDHARMTLDDFYAELLFSSGTCDPGSLLSGVYINPSISLHSCTPHTFGDHAIAECGQGAEYDALGGGFCLMGGGSRTDLLILPDYIGIPQDEDGWVAMPDIQEDGTSNQCASLCTGLQPICRAYITKDQQLCGVTLGIPTKIEEQSSSSSNQFWCHRKGGFSRILWKTYADDSCATETSMTSYDSPLSCARLSDGIFSQAVFEWENVCVCSYNFTKRIYVLNHSNNNLSPQPHHFFFKNLCTTTREYLFLFT